MFKYLKANEEPEVQVVNVSRKIWPDNHLLPDPETREPIVVNKGDVDVDAMIQAGAPLCLDLNVLMEQDLEAADELRGGSAYDKDGKFVGYGTSADVIDTTAATNLKEALNSVQAAKANAKAAGYDDLEAYFKSLIQAEIEKTKEATAAASGEENK